jgi:hypothetical protein
MERKVMNAIVSHTQIDFQTFNIQHDTADLLGIHEIELYEQL